MPRTCLLSCLLGLLATLPAAAHEFVSKSLRVEHPWAAPAAAGSAAVPVFLSIENTGDRDQSLVSVATTAGLARAAAVVPPAATASDDADASAGADADAHADTHTNAKADAKAGVRVVVPAGGHAQIDADHARIELRQLGIALQPGMRFPMFLTFAGGAQLEIEVWVEAPDAHAAHAHAVH